jgi:hypothetical protein
LCWTKRDETITLSNFWNHSDFFAICDHAVLIFVLDVFYSPQLILLKHLLSVTLSRFPVYLYYHSPFQYK